MSTPDSIRAAAERIPPDYSYRLTSSCGERALIGTYDIVVQDRDRVVSGARADGAASMIENLEYPTIKALLDDALRADSPAEVEFETDAAGLPARLSIDGEPDAIDDEECYVFAAITPVTRVPGRPSPG